MADLDLFHPDVSYIERLMLHTELHSARLKPFLADVPQPDCVVCGKPCGSPLDSGESIKISRTLRG